MIKIVVLKITDRIKEAGLAQDILSKYSSVIATRLGFHELNEEICGREACIILHLTGDPGEWSSLIGELSALGGLQLIETDMSEAVNEIISPNPDWDFTILSILTERGRGKGIEVQRILTSYGCEIRSRLGVNESLFGKPYGLIILELKPTFTTPENILKKLNAIEGVKATIIRL